MRANLRLGAEDPEALLRHGGGGGQVPHPGAHRQPALQPGPAGLLCSSGRSGGRKGRSYRGRLL